MHNRSHLATMCNQLPGALITLEGIDGSGKTLLLTRLKTYLTEQGYRVITTKEPGGTPIGKMLKRVLLEEEKACDPRVEYLLFAADRAEHFARLVIPALEQGAIVISDRMADSALAYQGYGRGLDTSLITMVNEWAMRSIVPDATLYLKISPELSAQRRAQRSDSTDTLEREKLPFWQAVSDGYDAIAQTRESFITIDASRSKEDVFEQAQTALSSLLASKPLLAKDKHAYAVPNQ